MHHNGTQISQRLAKHFEEKSVATLFNKTVGRNQYFGGGGGGGGPPDVFCARQRKKQKKNQMINRE
jgi:hypothetical protein